MRRFLSIGILLTVAFATATMVSAQTLTDAERDRAMKYLESTKQAIVDDTTGLSAAQWNFKAAPDRWSVAEVMEHIAAAEDLIRTSIENEILKAPARTEAVDVAALDDFVMKAITDRSHKAQAPEPLKPSNRFGTPEAAVKHFVEARALTEAILRDHADLRAHAADSPLGKKLDAYEWLLFVGAHSARHTKQIEEVKADPSFPRK